MSKCPIPGCDKPHKNQFEHFLGSGLSISFFHNDPKRGVTNEVTTPESGSKRPKEAEIKPVTTVTTVTTQRKSSQKEIDKVKAWRKANREKYNEYMRGQRAKKGGAK